MRGRLAEGVGEDEPPFPAPSTRPAITPRDPEAYALAVLEALDDVGEATAEAPANSSGVGVIDGCLELTLTGAGLIGCFVEPDWAAHLSGEELTEAFNATLAAAREDLAAASDASPSGRLRKLLDEGFAILDDARGRPLLPTTRGGTGIARRDGDDAMSGFEVATGVLRQRGDTVDTRRLGDEPARGSGREPALPER